jgi:DNA-binding HxlR family transcriptional regulator
MPILEYIGECQTCNIEPEIRKNLCTVCMTQKIVKGKWKIVILWLLRDKTLRFSQIRKSIPKVTQTYLSNQLRALEDDKLIIRKSYNQVPPKVEYSLSSTGIKFISVLDQMNVWGMDYMQEHVLPIMESESVEQPSSES